MSSFEQLVAQLSTHFITLTPEETDAGVDRALEQLGRFCGVDRAYIFRFDEETTSNTHEWCAAGIEPQIQNFQDVPYEAFPWWAQQVRAGEIIHVEDLSELPEEAEAERAILAEQAVRSVVSVPLAFGKQIFGFVGFDSVKAKKRWPEEDIRLLRVVGEMLVNVMIRAQAELERRRLESQLAEARNLEAVGRLAGGVAHDFNNMLMVVMNLARLLAREAENDTHRSHARQIVASAERAAELTQQLLRIGRREVVSHEVVDLAAVIRDFVPLLHRTLREDIELELSLDTSRHVEIGRPQLEQVLVNLVYNARDAMPKGGKLSISLSEGPGRDDEPWVVLEVRDTGQGMPAAVRERAFEPFFTTKGDRGTGLGLATVYGIVKQAGGRARVDSEPGKGTGLIISFPTTKAPLSVPPTRVVRGAPTGTGETVLVVEDDEEVRTVVATALEGAGYRVLIAATGTEAIELVKSHSGPLDVMVTDVIMPGPSGEEVAREVRDLRPGVHVVYMSGYDDERLDRVDVKAPRLQKPFPESELLRAVRSALA